MYRRSRREQLHAALHDFTIAGAEDPKGAIIFADFFMYRNWGLYLVFYFYDGEKPPSTGPFAEMLKVPAMVSLTSTKKYSTLTFTLPAIPSNPHVYQEIASQWRHRMMSGRLDQLRHFPNQCSIEYQPLPAAVGLHSEQAGGNAMGLRAADPNRIVLNLQCMWPRARDDAAMRAGAAGMTDWLEERLPTWKAQAGLGAEEDHHQTGTAAAAAAYMPLFMNDAMSDQDVLGSYRGYEKFRELQRGVDPEGMFRSRVGGYRY
ncbi:FAD-binding domain-containing protein [Apiospora rasikravindrae]|uniref:FAD-binding domain-containing protein n=1 Tax=Apiospora rasikravindrae TaxID=990691 RepID=A0ABR1TYZ0_9PEZI